MRGEKLISNIGSPNQIGKAEIADMRISLQAFPYFSSMQLLYTKGLYNTDSISYNRQLRKAAAYAGDRKLLFKLITENVKAVESTPTKNEQAEVEIVEEKTLAKKAAEKELAIGSPLEFSENETHSFTEWLSLTEVRKIDRKNIEHQEDLIGNFIENEPSISKPKKEGFFSPAERAKESLGTFQDLRPGTRTMNHFQKAGRCSSTRPRGRSITTMCSATPSSGTDQLDSYGDKYWV